MIEPPPADDPRRCQAKSKRSQEQCKAWAIVGLTVCRMHGANADARAAAQKRQDRAFAEKALRTYGEPVAVDPLDALLAELHRTAGHVAWLALLIGDLEHGVNDEGRLRSGLKQYNAETGERPSVWIQLYQSERAHLARVASDCLKANIDERRVKLAEDQGRLVADVITRIVTSLGHDTADPGVREVVRRELTLVSGGAA